MNVLRPSMTFQSLYGKKKSKFPELVERTEKILIKLRESDDPESLGVKKSGELREYRTIRINDNHRIMYRVTREDGKTVVHLFRICNHKVVYAPL